jgi:hypothetical protein
VILAACVLALAIFGQPRVFRGIVPEQIKYHLENQKALAERFSGT